LLEHTDKVYKNLLSKHESGIGKFEKIKFEVPDLKNPMETVRLILGSRSVSTPEIIPKDTAQTPLSHPNEGKPSTNESRRRDPFNGTEITIKDEAGEGSNSAFP
jgi:hypothetical protein